MKKTFFRFWLLLALGFATVGFYSCGDEEPNAGEQTGNNDDDDDDDDEDNVKLSKLDISNSTALFIASSDPSYLYDGKLYKITNNGAVEEVSCLDEAGKPITDLRMGMICVIANSDYFVVNTNYSSYLVRKSDGAAFALDARIGDRYNNSLRTGGYANSDFIVQDASKNLYFIEEFSSRVYKLDISNPANITSTPITPGAEPAWDFTVSAKGDVLYHTSDNVIRVLKSNGGLYNLNVRYNGDLNSWTGFDGKIKYGDGDNTLFTVNIETNGNVSIAETLVNRQVGGFYPARMLRFSNRIILLSSYGYNNLQEVENPSNNPRSITLSYGINTVKGAVNSENYYYINGLNSSQQPFLIKVNAANDAVTELFNAGDYNVYAMAVSKTDELIFAALRMSDGVKVIGKVSSTGNLQIIDTQLGNEVIVLECIQ